MKSFSQIKIFSLGIFCFLFLFVFDFTFAQCDYDHGGTNWVVTDNDAFDLNSATETIEIAGVHCNINNFKIPTGTTVYVKAFDGVNYGSLEIRAEIARINGTLDASGRGYPGGEPEEDGQGPGAGLYYWCTGSGAGHGGKGGKDWVDTAGGNPNGSFIQPVNLGSGGGGGLSSSGGAGGGAIKLIISHTLTINGIVSANGENSPEAGCQGGGGSGGSIWIETQTITGSGTISANGGEGGNFGGGGAGGRIAIYYTNITFSGIVSAFGGKGYENGAVGTIYFKNEATSKEFRYDLCGFSLTTICPVTNTFLRLDRDYTIPPPFQTLLIPSGYNFTIDSNTNFQGGNVNTLTVDGEIIFGDNCNFGAEGITSLNLNGRILTGTHFNANFLLLSSLSFSGTFFLGSYSTITFSSVTSIGTATFSYGYHSTLSFPSTSSISVSGNFSAGKASVIFPLAQEITISGTLAGGKIEATTTNLTVEVGGKIDTSGRGHEAGPGVGGSGSTIVSECYGGGGYGGEGGKAVAVAGCEASGGSPYGSLISPNEMGSGGTGQFNGGGDGGGLVRLIVSNILSLNGEILANGGNGGTTHGSRGAGGSGGGIYLKTNILKGNSTISANGGNGYFDPKFTSVRGGGGGGGRIAIYYTTSTFTGTISAHGGTGYEVGGAGTIYLKKDSDLYGSLTVDNANISSYIPPFTSLGATSSASFTFQSLSIFGKAHLKIPTSSSVTFLNSHNLTAETWIPEGSITLGNSASLYPSTTISSIIIATGTALTLEDSSHFNFPDVTTLRVNPTGTIALGANSNFNLPSLNSLITSQESRVNLDTNSLFNTPSLTTLTVGGIFVYSNPLNFNASLSDLTILSTGVLTHNRNYDSKKSWLELDLNNLTIESGGEINVDGKGYAGGEGGGNGKKDPGGGKISILGGPGTESEAGGGGGYGGEGGDSEYSGYGGISYPSLTHPEELGSGGAGGMHGDNASAGAHGGAGGGAIKLVIYGTLILDGKISANGAKGNDDLCCGAGGGGSGGSIWIEAQTLTGSGTISANGGNGGSGDHEGGGGGGGRIAIYYTTSTFTTFTLYATSGELFADGNLFATVYGGSGFEDGEVGTIYFPHPPEAVNLTTTSPVYCEIAPGTGSIFFSWTYEDQNDPPDPQAKFDFRVNDVEDPEDSNPEIDRSITFTCASPCSNSQSALIQTSLNGDNLTYGQEYFWWVRVWDDTGLSSDWIEGPSFTIDLHPYPWPEFKIFPSSPTAKEEITFEDHSLCWDLNGQYNCKDSTSTHYIWNFGDGTICDSGVGTTSPCRGTVTHTYDLPTTTQVSLQIFDQDNQDNFECSTSTTLYVKYPLPKWKEIAP
jgi:hypothetical protein